MTRIMADTIRFTNCYVAQPNGTVEFADLYISPSTGRIVSGQGAFFGSRQSPTRTLDLGGAILAPGLIDVQINGAFGVDFSELEVDDADGGERAYVAGLEKVARGLVASGVTSFVPTIITQKEDMYAKLLKLLRPRAFPGAAQILGYHAEGPFLHPHRRGAHSQPLLMVAEGQRPMETVDRVYGKEALEQDGVKIITLAPDVHGVMDCIEELSARGVTVSIGHSDATLEIASQAMDKGARMITHLFNAMPPIHHRDPGVIGLLGQPGQRPYYGIIVDALHLHPNTVRIAYGACKEGCVVVTDAQSPMDPALPDGVHDWRPGVKFRKEGYKVTIEGTDTLAGSCCPLNEQIANLASFASIPLPEALLASTSRPAALLAGQVGARKGQLREGFDADLCIMGWDGKVWGTWAAGQEVFRRESGGGSGGSSPSSEAWKEDVLVGDVCLPQGMRVRKRLELSKAYGHGKPPYLNGHANGHSNGH